VEFQLHALYAQHHTFGSMMDHAKQQQIWSQQEQFQLFQLYALQATS